MTWTRNAPCDWSTIAPGWPPRRARSWTARCRAADARRPARAAPVSYPEHLRTQIEDYLEKLHFSEEAATSGLEEAMRYSLAGGKRIQPVLALTTAEALDEVQPSCCRWPPRWS